MEKVKRKRTQQELVEEAFRQMWNAGELVPKKIYIPLMTGGVHEQIIYKVKPDDVRHTFDI